MGLSGGMKGLLYHPGCDGERFGKFDIVKGAAFRPNDVDVPAWVPRRPPLLVLRCVVSPRRQRPEAEDTDCVSDFPQSCLKSEAKRHNIANI